MSNSEKSFDMGSPAPGAVGGTSRQSSAATPHTSATPLSSGPSAKFSTAASALDAPRRRAVWMDSWSASDRDAMMSSVACVRGHERNTEQPHRELARGVAALQLAAGVGQHCAQQQLVRVAQHKHVADDAPRPHNVQRRQRMHAEHTTQLRHRHATHRRRTRRQQPGLAYRR